MTNSMSAAPSSPPPGHEGQLKSYPVDFFSVQVLVAPVLNHTDINAQKLGEFKGELRLNTKIDISYDGPG